MNFSSEHNKPIFVARPTMLNASNSVQMVNEALANRSLLLAKHSGDYIVKTSAARQLRKSSLVSLEASTDLEIKDLVVARLESDQDQKFRFLDGREYSGAEAAREVSGGTEVGKYFLELEKETVRIVQEAFNRGEF
jgi:hypothetical protein